MDTELRNIKLEKELQEIGLSIPKGIQSIERRITNEENSPIEEHSQFDEILKFGFLRNVLTMVSIQFLFVFIFCYFNKMIDSKIILLSWTHSFYCLFIGLPLMLISLLFVILFAKMNLINYIGTFFFVLNN